MTDKDIILKTLKHIKFNSGHTEIKPFWNKLELTNEVQTRLKLRLEENNLAIPHIYDAWSLMITSEGLRIRPDELNNDGSLRRKK